MSAENLNYFKFVSEIIRSGLWSTLSSAGRALYPVLLSFSDKDFKAVYPGTRVLQKLTGFQHKASLRKARQELVKKGLITISTGSGRRNTSYYFCFDFPRSLAPSPTTKAQGYSSAPLGAPVDPPEGHISTTTESYSHTPPYNQIHISINNHLKDKEMKEESIKNLEEGKGEFTKLDEKERWLFLQQRFGQEAIRLACSECRLGRIAESTTNVEKILYQNNGKRNISWQELRKVLAKQISPSSLELISRSYVENCQGQYIFHNNLPSHLRALLERICENVFFEPKSIRPEQMNSPPNKKPIEMEKDTLVSSTKARIFNGS